jgi:hypothetical protein
MRQVQKNEFHTLIAKMSLDPNRFSLTDSVDEDNRQITTITLLDSELKYIVRNAKDSWEEFNFRYTEFKPKYPLTDWLPNMKGLYFSFSDLSNDFYQWLKSNVLEYIKEIDSEDKWANFQFEATIFELTQVKFANNSNFSQDESLKIKTSIANFKQLVYENFSPTNEQIEFINTRLDYLVESVDGLGKFDWTNTFIAIMISIAINMCFDTETGKHFFNLIKQAFATIRLILGD